MRHSRPVTLLLLGRLSAPKRCRPLRALRRKLAEKEARSLGPDRFRVSDTGKLAGILIGVPVIRREFDAPKTRAGREKFNSDTHALVRRIAQGDNSTYLLLFGDKIGEDNIGADFHRLVQVKQTTMRIYHDRFGVLAEVLAVGALARSAHGYAYPQT